MANLNHQCKIYKITQKNRALYDNEDVYLVFNMMNASKLREKRLSGRFIGSILSAQQTNNEIDTDKKSGNYLPLKLTELEIGILIEYYMSEFKILKSTELTQAKLSDFEKKFEEYNENLMESKNRDYISLRRNQLVSMRDKIISSKRKKLNEQLSKLDEKDNEEKNKIQKQIDGLEESFEQDLENLESNLKKENFKQSMPKESQNTELFMQTPAFYESIFPSEEIPRSDLNFLLDKLKTTCRYNAFKYLWNQGYYLTCGAKFGGDFLVYPGKPAEYHSQFILVCIEGERKYTFKELVTFSRMATTVKKTYLMAMFVDKQAYFKCDLMHQVGDKMLVLTSINWAHF